MGKKVDKKDVILGIIMITLSLYMFLGSNVIVGKSILKENITVGRADFYIKFLATALLVISFVMILKALGLFSSSNDRTNSSPATKTAKLSFVALIIYTVILKPIGFFISSFVLVTFLSLIIRLEETKINPQDRKDFVKPIIISCTFSLISVLSIMYVFTKWLKVILP